MQRLGDKIMIGVMLGMNDVLKVTRGQQLMKTMRLLQVNNGIMKLILVRKGKIPRHRNPEITN